MPTVRHPQTRGYRAIFTFILIILGLGFLLAYGPSLTGLVGATETTSVLLNLSVHTSTTIPLTLARGAQSISVLGHATGSGFVSINLLEGTNKHFIYEGPINGATDLAGSCAQCALVDGLGVLDVEVSGESDILLDSLSYEQTIDNEAPQWVGQSMRFLVRPAEPLHLSLSGYVLDPENDPLTYVVAADEHFAVEVAGDDLVITSSSGYLGSGTIVIYASDAHSTTRIPIEVVSDLISTSSLAAANAPAEVSASLLDELELSGEMDVIVVLRDPTNIPAQPSFGASNTDKARYLDLRQDAISVQASTVLNNLQVGEYRGRGARAALEAASEADIEFRLKATYSTVPAFSGRITLQGYQQLMNDPRVLRIVKDLPFHLATNVSVAHARADFVRNMTLAGINLNGSGFSACVIDSGIDMDHEDFNSTTGPSRILNQSCFCSITDYGSGGCCQPTNVSERQGLAFDDFGHGTLVTGVIASDNTTFLGVAPGAGIVAVKTFNASGDALFSDIALAVDHCIGNMTLYNITTIQMSFGTNVIGGTGTEFDQSADGFSQARICDNLSSSVGTLTSQLNLAAGLGIIPVASSGNDEFFTGISYPACMSNVTSVSAIHTNNSVAIFANNHALNDAFAVGVNICAARGNESNNLSFTARPCDGTNEYVRANGTSFSAPHLAGAIILLRQVVEREHLPNLTINRISELLNSSDVFITDSFNGVVRPRLNVLNMIVKLARNYTINGTNGTITLPGIGTIDYVNSTDLTQILSCINISQNRLVINQSGNCPRFNISSVITINNINSSLTRVLRDGVPCPASICSGQVNNATAVSFSATQAGTYSADDGTETIGVCRDLNVTGTTYILNSNVRANATCFTVTADTVSLDCSGRVVEFGANGSSNAYGVRGVNRSSIAIRNCDIRDVNASGSDSLAIYMTSTNTSTFFNNSLQTNGTDGNFGILLERNSVDNRIYNNTIRGRGSGSDNYGLYLFTDTRNTLITNNTIRTLGVTGGYGIVIENFSTSNNLSFNTIYTDGLAGSTDNYGIYILSASSLAQIINNTVWTSGEGNGFGIVLENISGSHVTNNTINSSGGGSDNYGVYLFKLALSNLVSANTIHTNGSFGNYGIAIESAPNNSLLNNTIITKGTSSDNYGIYAFVSSDNLLIHSNNISTNGTSGNYGIVVENSTAPNITFNRIRTGGISSDNYGLYLLRTASPSFVTNNSVYTTGTGLDFGIVLENSSRVNVTHNRIWTYGGSVSGNDNYGVYLLQNSANNTIRGNLIVANGTGASNDGVHVEASSNNTIFNNTIKAFGTLDNHGIVLNRSSLHNNVSDNYILVIGTTNNRGVHILGNSTIIRNNLIRTNGSSSGNYGLFCDGARDLIIRNNTITTNGTTDNVGIELDNCLLNLAVNNTIVASGTTTDNHGIRLFNSTNNTIVHPSITVYGDGDGIRFSGSSNNSIHNASIVAPNDGVDFEAASNGNHLFNTFFNNTPGWIRSSSTASANNFTSTNFSTQRGHIRTNGTFVVNASQTINRSNLDITANAAFIDTDSLAYLNISSQIRLLGITASSPNMRVDLEDDSSFLNCEFPQCEFINYVGTEFTFNVSRWTTYSLSDNSSSGTPSGPAPGSGGGGGGQTSRYVYANTIHNPLPPPAPKISPPIIVSEPEPVIEVPVLEVLPSPAHYCGDGTCDRGEDSFSCSADCGVPPPPQAPQPVREPISWRTISGIFFGLALLLLVILALIKLYENRPPKSAFAPAKKSYDTQLSELMGRMEQRAPPPLKNAAQKKAPKLKKK